MGRWRRVDGARTKTVSLDKSTSDVLINSIKQLYPLPVCIRTRRARSKEEGGEPFLKFIAGLRSSMARGPGMSSWRAVRLNIKRVGKFGTTSQQRLTYNAICLIGANYFVPPSVFRRYPLRKTRSHEGRRIPFFPSSSFFHRGSRSDSCYLL